MHVIGWQEHGAYRQSETWSERYLLSSCTFAKREIRRGIFTINDLDGFDNTDFAFVYSLVTFDTMKNPYIAAAANML
jgi:hypothetical protein